MSNPDQRKLAPPSFAALVQAFFTEHLTQQRALSARTVAAYRDAFLLFLDFAQTRLHKAPTAMLLADVTPVRAPARTCWFLAGLKMPPDLRRQRRDSLAGAGWAAAPQTSTWALAR